MVNSLLLGTTIPLNKLLSWHLSTWAVENAQLMNGVRMGLPDPASFACSSKKSICRAPADKKGLQFIFPKA